MNKLDFSGYNLPEHTQGALTRWVNEGTYPGGFLESVLSNALFGAIGQADRENTAALRDIVMFVYNEVPASAWGSKEKVHRHAEKFLYEQLDKVSK